MGKDNFASFDPDFDFDELVGAEDFLSFFAIPFDAAVVQVNRLHIMQKFHDLLTKEGMTLDPSDPATFCAQQRLLAQAYAGFVESGALDHRVFRVLKDAVAPKGVAFVSIDSIGINKGA